MCVSFVNYDLINNGVTDIYTLYYPCFSANHQRLGTFAFATARDGVTWRYGDLLRRQKTGQWEKTSPGGWLQPVKLICFVCLPVLKDS